MHNRKLRELAQTMSRHQPKVCTTPGCPQLRPCPTHQPPPWANSTRKATLPPDWNQRRARILHRDPICQLQTPGICTHTSTEVDHDDNGPHDHSRANLRGVCAPCHAHRTKQQAAAGRRRR